MPGKSKSSIATASPDSRIHSREEIEAGRVDFSGLVTGRRLLLPLHPGEMLEEEFLKPLGLSAYRLAKIMKVPVNRVTTIVAGRRSISADTALRLARAFGMSAEFWLNLQQEHDLRVARHADARRIAREVKPLPLDENGALKVA